MDEKNKDVTEVTNEIDELIAIKDKLANEKAVKEDAHVSVMLFAVIVLFIAMIGLLIWDGHNDRTINKQKARIEELEERLNYKTTVEIGPLPCPFCGSELVETMYDRYHGYYIHCEECGGQTGYPHDLLSDDEVTMSEAVTMWNNMAGMEVREQLEQETEETE